MKNLKKLLSALLCAATLAACAPGAAAYGTNDSQKLSFSDGKIIKCGKYLVTAAKTNKNGKTNIVRTNLHGKNVKIADKTATYEGVQLCCLGSLTYYRKGEKIISYNPKTDKKQTAVELDPDNIYTDITLCGICSAGFAVNYRGDGLYLVGFDGSRRLIAACESVLDGCYPEFLGATEESIFYYRTEKYSSKRYTSRLYRADLNASQEDEQSAGLTAVKLSTFTSQKKPSGAPYNPQIRVLGKKIAFMLSTAGDEGCIYSANADGTGIKKLGEKFSSALTPGNGCAYVSGTYKDNLALYKITSAGKLKRAAVCKNIKYPSLSYTTSTGRALGIMMSSKQDFGYNLYAVPGVKAAAGKKVIEADTLVTDKDSGYLYIMPSIGGSAGDMVMVTYNVYRYDNKGRFEKFLRDRTYIVNAKTAKKAVIC